MIRRYREFRRWVSAKAFVYKCWAWDVLESLIDEAAEVIIRMLEK